jgi:AcrR family transcriptional regulator
MSSSETAQRPGRREAEARATRDALIAAALQLFTQRGYSGVGTEEIVARAKVTRGALYHHFSDKRDLFRAVFERVEHDLVERVAASMDRVDDSWELMLNGVAAFLDACEDPAVKQISLTDAPAVLGWQEWREMDNRYGLGLTRAALQAAVDAGVLRPIPVDAMAHLFVAALSEAAFVIAHSDAPRKARAEVDEALLALIEGLAATRPRD